jgi:hypothetical protein
MEFRKIPGLQRRRFWLISLATGTQLAILVYTLGQLLWFPASKVPIGVHVWANAASILFIIACTMVMSWLNYRTRDCAIARHGAICIHCLYDLPQDQAQGTCPECGHAFTARNNRIAWDMYVDPDPNM